LKIGISKKNSVFIKINIRHLKTSILKLCHKDFDQLQNLVILLFTFITGFWNKGASGVIFIHTIQY